MAINDRTIYDKMHYSMNKTGFTNVMDTTIRIGLANQILLKNYSFKNSRIKSYLSVPLTKVHLFYFYKAFIKTVIK